MDRDERQLERQFIEIVALLREVLCEVQKLAQRIEHPPTYPRTSGGSVKVK